MYLLYCSREGLHRAALVLVCKGVLVNELIRIGKHLFESEWMSVNTTLSHADSQKVMTLHILVIVMVETV